MEAGRWIVFPLLNILIFLTWFGIQNRQSQSAAPRLLTASVLSIAQIWVSIFLLGLPWSKLTAPNLVIVNSCFSLVLLFFVVARRDFGGSLRDLGGAFKHILMAVNSATIPKILAMITVVVILWTVCLGVIYPPIEWDSLMYHLPAVGHYMQQKSIADPSLPMGLVEGRAIDSSIWVNSFPKNTELLFLWAAIIPGSDTLVDLIELLFGLLGIVAVYSLAKSFGVDRKWAISAGFLFFLTPIVIAQSRSNYNDLSNNVLILIALALLYPGEAERRPVDVVVAGIAVGFVLGAKWSGVMFLPVLWLMLVGQRLYWNHRDRLPKFGKVSSESVAFMVPALFFGAYWYVKNWYLYGNPLWPFRLSVLGIEVFQGIITQKEVLSWTFPTQLWNLNMAQMFWVSWREIGITDYVHDIRPGGLGPFWFILGLPAIFYVLRWVIRRRDWAQALIFLAAALILIFHPENWWTRYTMFVAGLGAIAFVMLRSADHRPEVTRLIDIMLVLIVVYSTGAAFMTGYYQPAKITALLKKRPDLRTSGSVRPEIISPAYDYIVKVTVDKPANIAYGSGLNFTYPLWGSSLKNHVYYIKPKGLASWVGKLRAKKIKYLMIGKNSPERKLVGDSSHFNRVYFDRKRGYAVYAFNG